jgi:hypothetical protein
MSKKVLDFPGGIADAVLVNTTTDRQEATMNTTTTPVLIDVQVEAETLETVLTGGTPIHGWNVRPVWANVDRPTTSGWFVSKPALRDRLVAAIKAGRAVTPHGIATDVGGKTYVATTHVVSGRHMNADLKRLGF